ncbi:predicted protein [Nematostella vectensis]|uniref:Uncharacterized protein n=1 Tax=Nematostella vectensis TaxID=45351 RepID=A7S501_NEMVE|nr:predicted protein [Nematostella vectensis]|eukprot:XP_001633308.1 predicted protein [Nematostella vectensis]
MEEELQCPVCNKPYNCPVVLPCSHSICMSCTKAITTTSGADYQVSSGEKEPVADPFSDDSGYVSVYEVNHLYQAIGNFPCLKCPICRKIFPLDGRGVNGFPRNKLLENIVNRHYAKSNGNVYCQLCEGSQPAPATVMCEQCEVSYCEECCKTCHPSRGPLAKHNLIHPASSKASSVKSSLVKCKDHLEEHNSMYCVVCRIPVCYVCIERGQHKGHEVKALGAMFKEQKSELGNNLNLLEENRNHLQNYINQLQESCSVIQENGLDFEASVVAQCDGLIQFIENRKMELINAINKEMQTKVENVKQQITEYEHTLKDTVGLLGYSREALKETDPASFLLVRTIISHEICGTGTGIPSEPPSVELDLTLDTSATAQALHELHFVELKAPDAPDIIPDQCSVTNNTITLCWMPRKQSCIESYLVEIDDGNGGSFVEVYRGNSLECTVQGLQFDSTYRARVKGINKSGEGGPSDEVYLTTSDIAWFSLDLETAHPDIILSNDNNTATCTSFDDRVVLGGAGFSKGCHYWEVTIDRYDGNPDPAMGVAFIDTIKDSILGKDDKAWCMYIDSSRSWFRHNNEHSNRRDGGIEVGSCIGILLDISNLKVSFYLNDQRRGAIRLPSISGALYPAFSLNRNVQITLHTGLEPPDQ